MLPAKKLSGGRTQISTRNQCLNNYLRLMEEKSLNKYISESGYCSRREADKLIEEGRVLVNGELASKAARVYPGDQVEVEGQIIKHSGKTIYIAFNKPKGITTTTDKNDKYNIIEYIRFHQRIFPIGRLDKDSDGLILLTNDGDIVNKILRAGNNHNKEYIVTVDKPVTPEFVQRMSNGVRILGQMTQKCFVRQEGKMKFRIVLTQGMNRQIRRMAEVLGYKVKALTRIRIMNISLGGIQPGRWRYLTPTETEKMLEMVATSRKTEDASVLKKGSRQIESKPPQRSGSKPSK
jgi:23S rRNA pseudouridine2604 synthase